MLAVCTRERCLKAAVPLLSFGCTLAGILLWQAGIRIEFQYYAIGCVAGSCILAYLAWIRPRKDIVALSTPLYAVIFFTLPSDFLVAVVIQLLCAAGLTILLIRLDRRFGNEACGTTARQGPLMDYAVRVREQLSPEPAVSRAASLVFVRFAQGDYEAAAAFAAELSGMVKTGPVASAAAIVAEQAGHLLAGATTAGEFLTFEDGDRTLLWHPAGTGEDRDREYGVTLDNALLLLFAVAASAPEEGELVCSDPLWKFASSLAVR